MKPNRLLPRPAVEWTGPTWRDAEAFVLSNPGYSLEAGRINGEPLLYRQCTQQEAADLSSGLTGIYENGRKVAPLSHSAIKIAVDWGDVLPGYGKAARTATIVEIRI